MKVIKHIKRFFKSINKRVIQPMQKLIKPAVRFIKNDPYEIFLSTNIDFKTSDFVVVNNVVDYEFYDFNSWKIQALSPKYEIYTTSLLNNSTPIYIAIDTKFHDSFGHWFFESAIWIPRVKFFLYKFPSAKLHLKECKGYKTQILNYFGISEDRVVTKILERNNLCIFTNPCTSLNDSRENKKFKELLCDFSNAFHKRNVVKSIDCLLMPRQKKGNYISNDRQVNTDDLELYLKTIPNTEIFNAENYPEFSEQVSKVQTSKYLVVTDGSAFTVNAFLAKNSVVFVLGDKLVPNQRHLQEKMRIICEFIEHNNAVMYIHSDNNIFTRQFLDQWFNV